MNGKVFKDQVEMEQSKNTKKARIRLQQMGEIEGININIYSKVVDLVKYDEIVHCVSGIETGLTEGRCSPDQVLVATRFDNFFLF